MRRHQTGIALATIAAVSLGVMLRQLHGDAIFSCSHADTVYYVSWVRQTASSFAAGIFLPRWMPDSNAGYGNPTLVFYPPLVIHLTALLVVPTGSVFLAIAAVKFLSLLLSGTFMYVFARAPWGFRPALVAACVYMLLPFRIFDLYYLGVYASKFAFVWFPLILHFCRRAVSESRMGAGSVGLAVVYALLCLTHLLSAYMFLPVLFAFGLVWAGRGRLALACFRLVTACLLGIAASAVYLVPVAVERSQVHFEAAFADEYFHYWNNYLFYVFTPRSPSTPSFYGYVARVVVASVVCGLSFYVLPALTAKRLPRGRVAVLFVGVTAAAFVLMTSLSSVVWAVVPGMAMLQFPTRWAAVMTLGLAALAGAGAATFFESGPRAASTARAPVAFLLCVAVLGVLYDVEIASNACRLTAKELGGGLESADVREYVPANVSFAWLDRVIAGPVADPVSVVGDDRTTTVTVKTWEPQRRTFTVAASHAAVVRVRTFYYPGWIGLVDDVETPLATEAASGAILLRVPAGTHDVTLEFTDTADRRLGKMISALAIVALALLARR